MLDCWLWDVVDRGSMGADLIPPLCVHKLRVDSARSLWYNFGQKSGCYNETLDYSTSAIHAVAGMERSSYAVKSGRYHERRANDLC